ncbi:hypothetical protein WJX81_004382 [Elliptochloris bilobata]|uniref:Thymidylate kinase n=1 Tax=Elliptochloris bilobata TaxID=381761 RepID=A0AAW1QZZ6_9CHLO
MGGATSAGASQASQRGAFILFEGVDRCGKTTQSRRLVEHLQAVGVDAELWRFPDRTTAIGRMIDAYLSCKAEADDAAMHLLFSANRWEKRAALLAALAAGRTLVVDRYAYSGVAFTAAKRLPGLDLAWCQAPDRGLPAPDAIIYLELSIEDAMARGGFGGERYEREELQREVARQFMAMRDGAWHVLDASQSEGALHTQVRNIAEDVVDRCRAGPRVGTLWADVGQGRCALDSAFGRL